MSVELLNTWGSHRNRHNQPILATLQGWINECKGCTRACQIFVQGNIVRGPAKLSAAESKLISDYVRAHNLPLFIHAPYVVNLCRPSTKNNPSNVEWGLNIIRGDLRAGHAMGARGVVVHVGKKKSEDHNLELNNMFGYLRQLVASASESCPLLLETPAAQKSELCSTIEEFALMYRSFNEEERRKFKVCVDTCHVFSAGYDPAEYIQCWLASFPNSIALVHFNDSERERGCKVDRHAAFGRGHIGATKLLQVAEICVRNGIPMVEE